MRKYNCRFCGSCEVFHHCTGNKAVSSQSNINTVGACVNIPSVIEIMHDDRAVAICDDVPAIAHKQMPNENLCDVCNCPYDRQLRGFRWINGKVKAVHGDKLCHNCYETVLKDIVDYIPHPGVSKPVCQLVGLAKDKKSFVIERAITMAWCYGRAHRASRLKRLMRHVGPRAIVKVSEIV